MEEPRDDTGRPLGMYDFDTLSPEDQKRVEEFYGVRRQHERYSRLPLGPLTPQFPTFEITVTLLRPLETPAQTTASVSCRPESIDSLPTYVAEEAGIAARRLLNFVKQDGDGER